MRTCATLLLLVFLTCSAGAQNLLQNPSFEDLDDGKIAHWPTRHSWYEDPRGSGLSEVVPDDSVFQGAGHRSLKIVGTGNRGLARQVLTYDPAWGARMKLAGWIRLQDTGSACARIGVEFLDADGKWLGQAGVATDWRKSTADWELFEREFEVPEGTRHLVFNCGTDKANEGIVWFDNVSLEALAPTPPALEPLPGEEMRAAEALIPIDDFETDHMAWRANAWGGAEPARFELRTDGAPVGEGYLRVTCPSAKSNLVARPWNYRGAPWEAISFHVRRASGSGGLTLYLVCGGVYFRGKWFAPGEEWQQVTIRADEARYGWGAKAEEDKVFDPRKVTMLSFGHDDVIAYDLDHMALDVRDEVAIRAAYTDTRANLFSPGDAPVVKAEVFNAYATEQAVTLELELLDYYGRATHREARAQTLPARVYRTEEFQLPALGNGYWSARVRLVKDGRVVTQRAVGLCALPEPVTEGRPFMGASGFGLGAGTAEIGRRMGVRAAEFFIGWRDCEPEQGKLDLDRFEAILDVYEEHGFEVTGMVFLSPDRTVPDWASAAPDLKDRDKYFAKDPADFGRFMEALVRRYKDRVKYWSFCCEVDLALHRWAEGTKGYVEMTKAAYESAKRADPDCIVGGIGVSGVDCTRNPRFPVSRALWAELHNHLDGFFFDAYASPRYFAPALRVVGPEENDEEGMLREAVEIVRQYGPDKRVAIQEKGWAIDTTLPVDSPYARRMAEVLARSYIIARSVDEIEHYMWFQLVTAWDEGGYSYSLFRYEGDHINPRPGAAAYAAVAQFLGGVEDPRRIHLHQDLYAFAFAAGRGSRAALWTPLADPVSLDVTLPAGVRVTDLMGNETTRSDGAPLTLELSESPLYLWAEAVPVGRMAAALSEARFHLPAAKLALTVPDLETVRVHVRNLLAEDLTGRLAVRTPAGWRLETTRHEATIPAQETVVVPLQLAAPPEAPPAEPVDFDVRLRSPRHGQVRLTSEQVFLPVPRIAARPVIDADLSEYADLPAINLDSQKYLWPPDAPSAKLWTGVDDLSARVWVAWDDEAFYFAARVRDDVHVQERTGSSIWANDSFQIAFDPLNDALPPEFTGSSGYDPDDLEFGIALTPEGPQTFQWTGSPDGAGRLVPQLPLAVTREGDYTLYEWAVPWEHLAPLGPEAGRVFGFNFVLLDTDKPGETARYWMGLTPGICGGKDPSQFHNFVLVE